ncbi:MAG: aspartate/glutamate racemase family protein [SAR324 cluster bacterium]|nr:aspartate/glutamate racemase family protein [SAR324 cluster bacterium]
MSVHRRRILVINPNSNETVTEGISEALNALRVEGGAEIVCHTLHSGPYGIESQKDIDSVSVPLSLKVAENQDFDAFVIACYSDPGLFVCREMTSKPVFGMQESAVLTALARGDRFGVIAIAEASIKRHRRYLRQMDLDRRLAGERALEMSVAESASGEGSLEKMIEVGKLLKREDGADVVILGCAGMAIHRNALERELGVPVIDPTQAAVTMALGAVLLSS